jgi:RNA polymerase-binding transcription factor DksA
MRHKEFKEGLGDLAQRVEMDHEVQMARSDLYKIAKYAIKLHDMMKNVTEEEGIEGWQQAKITKAADYMSSVFHSLDYDMKFGEGQVAESKKDLSYKEALANKLSEAKGVCSECGNPSWTTLPEEKQKGVDGKVCWKGYKRMGTKKKGGKTVDNCVKM